MGVEMDIDGRELRRERSLEMRDQDDDSPTRERWEGGYDDTEEGDAGNSRESKLRSKYKNKSSSRREEKDHRSKDRERSKTSESLKEREKESSRDRRKEDSDEREKDKSREKVREKDVDRDKYKDKERDKDRKDRGKEKEREREREREREKELEKDGERGRDKERGKEKSKEKDRNREKERDRTKDREREREKERETHRDREKERDNERDKVRDASEREKGKERVREKEREVDIDREKLRERDRGSRKQREEDHDRGKDDKARLDNEDALDNDIIKHEKGYYDDEDERKTPKLEQSADSGLAGSQSLTSELEERILKMKEERLQKKSEGASEVLAWVNRSRKIQEKRKSEREKALQLSKVFEEQDNINQEESDDDTPTQRTSQNLGGAKILHGLDKVLEGGAVVLTLKDQSIIANGDINEEVDMLENIEIGEQKRRNEAYNAAKKKTGIYDDKFNDEAGAEKKILPQYDEPVDEGITLDASGRFSGEAEKKLEELRKRIQGVSTSSRVEDLNSSGRISSDYYTQEEMLQFKKPKKKKSLRKKEKLDLDALEAEAIAAGLGGGDLGSRKDGKRQTLREEEARAEAEMRSNAFQAAYAKAEEASKALRLERISTIPTEEDDTPVIGDDDEDLRKSLERARKLALKKQEEAAAASGPQVIARLAASTASKSTADNQDSAPGEVKENKVVFSEMEEFVWGLQLKEEVQKHDGEDVFMEEDEAPIPSDQGKKEEDGGWTEIKETEKEETPALDDEEEVVPDETIREAAVGKGLAGALKLLKDRGSLKETVEWGGRNMDKKKSKLVGIHDDDGQKEIRIERTDEYGRILTPKEAFRLLSHSFHGKGPGKMKQEKRMRQYQEELKVKQMKNADTPSQSVERMREVQAQLKTPYLVLSGHVKPGQTSDPRSGFATVEKDLPGGLTPMLGDKKVEHFLGLKRKSESGDAASQKKPKT